MNETQQEHKNLKPVYSTEQIATHYCTAQFNRILLTDMQLSLKSVEEKAFEEKGILNA